MPRNRSASEGKDMTAVYEKTLKEVAAAAGGFAPDLAEEVRGHLEAGHLVFLPRHVRVKDGKVWVGKHLGWMTAPGETMRKVKPEDIEMVYIAPLPDGKFDMAVRMKQSPQERADAAWVTAHYAQLEARLTPERFAEVQARQRQGELAFVPSQLKFERERIWFGDRHGWMKVPGYDPAKVPPETIVYVYMEVSGDEPRLGFQLKPAPSKAVH